MGASTVGALFLQAARQWPTKEALVEGSTVLTHEEAAARALAVAHRLIQWGIRPGDRVALALPNGWRYAVAYAGVQLAGGVAVLVNTRFAPTEITHVLTDSGSRVVVVDAEIAPRVPEVCPHLDVEGLTASGPGSSQPPGLEADTDDVANILYTSGTTGRPKGAMQTHGNLLFNAAAVGSVLGVRAEDRTLVVAPMFTRPA